VKRWAGIVLAILVVLTLPILFFLLLFTASMTEGFLWSDPSYESYKAGVWIRAICISVLTVPYVLVFVFGATEEHRRKKRIAAVVAGAAVVLLSCSLAAYWSHAFYESNVKYTWQDETLELQKAFLELGDDLVLMAEETNLSFGGGYPNYWLEHTDIDITDERLPYKRIVFEKQTGDIEESDYERIQSILPDVVMSMRLRFNYLANRMRLLDCILLKGDIEIVMILSMTIIDHVEITPMNHWIWVMRSCDIGLTGWSLIMILINRNMDSSFSLCIVFRVLKYPTITSTFENGIGMVSNPT
jgi:hypothetical protein